MSKYDDVSWHYDRKLTSEDLNNIANNFAQKHYETDVYIADYAEALGEKVSTLYHVKDSLKNALLIENIVTTQRN